MIFQPEKITTRSQKKRAVARLLSGDFEASVNENIPSEDLIAGPSKTLRIEPENLDEIKTSLRKEILSDLSKILAENQTEMLKLIAPLCRKRSVCTNDQDTDSESENISVARTSTPVKTITATNPKTTPVNSRNSYFKSLLFIRNTHLMALKKLPIKCKKIYSNLQLSNFILHGICWSFTNSTLYSLKSH